MSEFWIIGCGAIFIALILIAKQLRRIADALEKDGKSHD